MEIFNESGKNEKKEVHEDIVLRVFLQRHGPKFSSAGEKNKLAEYFGVSVEEGFAAMSIEDGEGLVHASSSPVKRAMATAEIGSEKISETEHRHKDKIGKQKDLATPFQPFGEATEERYSDDLQKIVEIQAALEPAAREKVENEHQGFSPEEKEAEVRNLIDTQTLSILFSKEEREYYHFQTSYEELADNLAKRYEGFLKHSGFLASQKKESPLQPKNEPYIQIDVSHSFPIMSFLKKYLVFDDGAAAKEMSSEDFFDRVGGVIGESDSLELDYKLDGENYIVKVKGGFAPNKNFSGQLNFKE